MGFLFGNDRISQPRRNKTPPAPGAAELGPGMVPVRLSGRRTVAPFVVAAGEPVAEGICLVAVLGATVSLAPGLVELLGWLDSGAADVEPSLVCADTEAAARLSAPARTQTLRTRIAKLLYKT
jgi:hypothetical protein